MVFTSLNFLLLLPVFLSIYYALTARYRWIFLLLASLVFYFNIRPVYLLILLFIGSLTYLGAILIDKTKSDITRSKYLNWFVVLLFTPLFFYKYFPSIGHLIESKFGIENFPYLISLDSLILPVGISFYTFMAVGYLVDVYNEEIVAEKHFGLSVLFVSFFPLLLSGPIERSGHMFKQFRNLPSFDFSNISAGAKMMIWGYFMKLVVADRLGIYVDQVYDQYESHNGTTLLFASILYPFQVYADLGGYSLIAIGVSRMMGINVIQNFRRPFFATSMAEFWRRWHISLITWLTDYLYTPLSFYFRKFKMTGVVLALLLTFLISGIWHGASMTFVIWGLLQGTFLSIEAITQKKRSALELKYQLQNRNWYLFIWMAITFLMFATSQIYARSENVPMANQIINKIFTQNGSPFLDLTFMVIGIIGLLIVLLSEYLTEFYKYDLLNIKNQILRYLFLISIILFTILLGDLRTNSFIYFQF